MTEKNGPPDTETVESLLRIDNLSGGRLHEVKATRLSPQEVSAISPLVLGGGDRDIVAMGGLRVHARRDSGQVIVEEFEINEYLGVTRLLRSSEQLQQLRLRAARMDRVPWWRVERKGPEIQVSPVLDPSGWFGFTIQGVSPELADSVAFAWAEEFIKLARDLTPAPTELFARATVAGSDIEQAARQLRLERTRELLELGRIIMEHATTRLGPLVQGAVRQAFEEAQVLAIRRTCGVDSRARYREELLARIEADVKASLGTTSKGGRPIGSVSFTSKDQFVATVFEGAYKMLERRASATLTEEKVATAMAKLPNRPALTKFDGRALRRNLRQYGLVWADLVTAAKKTFLQNYYPPFLS